MGDLDREPIPPDQTPLDQGLPPRPMPFNAVPGNVQFSRCKLQPGQDAPIIALVYDDPSTRTVSYWEETAFVQLARNMLRFAGEPSLTVADINDLRDLDRLRDVKPFSDGR